VFPFPIQNLHVVGDILIYVGCNFLFQNEKDAFLFIQTDDLTFCYWVGWVHIFCLEWWYSSPQPSLMWKVTFWAQHWNCSSFCSYFSLLWDPY